MGETYIMAKPKIVRLSEKGQLVLPLALRKKLGIAGGDYLIVDEKDGQIMISPLTIGERALEQKVAAE